MKLTATVPLATCLALAGCTTEFRSPDPDTGTDTGTIPDTTTDTGAPDTSVDPIPDTMADTWTDPEPDAPFCEPLTAEAGGTCSALHQCGCPPDQWCMFGVNFVDCVAMESCTAAPAGSQPVGSTCDDFLPGMACEPGLLCLWTPDGSRCFQYCTDDSQCMLEGQTCWMSLDIAGVGPCEGLSIPLPAMLCEFGGPTCERQCEGPFDTDSCPADHACSYDGACNTMVCRPAGPSGPGEPCDEVADCSWATDCFSTSMDEYFCLAWCDEAHPCEDLSFACTPLDLPDWPELAVCLG